MAESMWTSNFKALIIIAIVIISISSTACAYDSLSVLMDIYVGTYDPHYPPNPLWGRAQQGISAYEGKFYTVCFHCQQAAEKLLKGFLVAHGCEYPITHNLFAILEKVIECDQMAESLRETLALLNPLLSRDSLSGG